LLTFVLKLLNIFLWCTSKFFVGAIMANSSNIGFIPAFLATLSGGIFGVWFYIIFIERILILKRKYFPPKPIKKVKFNRFKRFLIWIKMHGGLWELSLLTPIILTIPVGIFLSITFFHNKKKIFFTQSVSVFIWTCILIVPFFLIKYSTSDYIANHLPNWLLQLIR